MRDSLSLTCIGRVTTLAGSAQGYKDGIGENAKFHHTSGEEYKMETEKCWKWTEIRCSNDLLGQTFDCQSDRGTETKKESSKEFYYKKWQNVSQQTEHKRSYEIKLSTSVKFVTFHLGFVVLYLRSANFIDSTEAQFWFNTSVFLILTAAEPLASFAFHGFRNDISLVSPVSRYLLSQFGRMIQEVGCQKHERI